MNIRPSSWAIAFLCTATCIALMLLAARCDASVLHIRLDPQSVPPALIHVAYGDTIGIEINKNAKVYLDESVEKIHYFEVFKRGRKIATVMPEHKKALIVHGDYVFKIRSLSDDHLVATVTVTAQMPGFTGELYGLALGVTIAFFVGILCLVLRGIKNLKNQKVERKFRKEHPGKLISAKWQR